MPLRRSHAALLSCCLLGCGKSAGTEPLPPPPACTDDLSTIFASPGAIPSRTGAILRCANDAPLTSDQVDSLSRAAGYTGPALPSGATVARVSYSTQRGTEPPTPGFSSALVFVPTVPRAKSLPVVVVAHGTIGEAPACAITQEPLTGADSYIAELAYPLVGAGYAVILPDFAGYAGFGAAGNPPSGYHSAVDEAKSVLDAARALRAFAPPLFSGDMVLVGHSQGGHAVLSALAMHAAYGSGGTLRGVVAYAPSWFPITSFGAMLAEPADFPLATQADTVAASVWYHYSHAELLDGPGTGVQVFAAAKRDAIRQFFEQTCDGNEQSLAALGTTPADLFDPGFVGSVSTAAGLGLRCLDANATCATWIARYAADRPHVTGDATKTPVLLVYGDQDEWIPAEREVCGFDRLASDGANVDLCIVAGATHDGSVNQRAAYASTWIGSLVLGEPKPAACGAGRDTLVDDAGAPVVCSTPPPND